MAAVVRGGQRVSTNGTGAPSTGLELIADWARSLVGLPAWEVTAYVRPTRIEFEFGEPHVRVRHPRPAPLDASPQQRRAARRWAWVEGDWRLLTANCDWFVCQDGLVSATSRSPDRRLIRMEAQLDGQAFTGVTVSPVDGQATFTFDLGGSLTVMARRGDTEPYELWRLRDPQRRWLVVRSDGRYWLRPRGASVADAVWLPLGVGQTQSREAGAPE